MAETLHIASGSRADKYRDLLPQIKGLVTGEPNLVANLANVCAALKETFGFFWVGFYIVDDTQLVLGPFQGPIACTRIAYGKGVCGKSWELAQTVLVPDVNQFPGHIACSSASQSEIVVPVFKNGKVVAVLDVDSDSLDDFSAVDQTYLEELMICVSDCF